MKDDVKLTAKDNLVVKSFNKSNALGKFCALIMSLVKKTGITIPLIKQVL
jgi:hypothetical protein